jgi:hypothetical protein
MTDPLEDAKEGAGAALAEERAEKAELQEVLKDEEPKAEANGGGEEEGLERVPLRELTGSAVFAFATASTFGFIHVLNAQNEELRTTAWDFVTTQMRLFAALVFFSMIEKVTVITTATFLPQAVGDPFISAGVYLFPALAVTVAMQYYSLETVGLTGFIKGVPRKEVRQLAWVGLLAETTAASWTYVFGNIQVGLNEQFNITWHLFPIVGIAALVWAGVLICSKALRNIVVFADGVVDEEEKEWLHLSEELEAEAGGMLLSYLVVQALRYYIGGKLPDDGGNEHGKVMHRWGQILVLQGCGILSGLFGAYLSMQAEEEGHHDSDEQQGYGKTWWELLKVFCFEIAGWCTMFTIQWTIQRQYNGREAGIMIRLLTAMVMTTVAFALIGLKAWKFGPEENQEALKIALITGMAVAGGFAWERCFDDAFESLGKEAAFLSFDDPSERDACKEACAEKEESKLTFFMDMTAFGISMPALYYHIAPVYLKMREEGTAGTPRGSEPRGSEPRQAPSDIGAGG